MCHLVSWKQTPRSDAGVSVLQTEVFVDEEEKTSADASTEFAESLATKDGIREVRLWGLVGEANPKISVEWIKAHKE